MDKKALIEVGKSFLRFVWFGLTRSRRYVPN
jgi:hypothetical protein